MIWWEVIIDTNKCYEQTSNNQIVSNSSNCVLDQKRTKNINIIVSIMIAIMDGYVRWFIK